MKVLRFRETKFIYQVQGRLVDARDVLSDLLSRARAHEQGVLKYKLKIKFVAGAHRILDRMKRILFEKKSSKGSSRTGEWLLWPEVLKPHGHEFLS